MPTCSSWTSRPPHYDPRSEHEVYRQFVALAQGRTTLLITHRLGSVTMADQILVMRQGRLVEQGSHHELLAKGGEYAELLAHAGVAVQRTRTSECVSI